LRRFGVVVLLIIQSAGRGLHASPVTSGVAVLTIAIALLLVGGFGLVVGNMQGLLDRFGEQLHVTAYLDSKLDEVAEWALADQVAKLEGVQGVDLVNKAEALERFGRSIGGADLLAGMEENPLPSSLEVALRPEYRSPEHLQAIAQQVAQLEGIDDLSHGQEWVEGYSRFAALVRLLAYGLGTVLALSAFLIVTNTIRLAVYARADEIEILDLVGASPVFIRTPFLLEGCFQGAVGGGLALIALWVVFQLALPRVEFGLEIFLGNTPPRFFSLDECAFLIGGGAALGALGSLAALVGWRS
jgi:cell division transport system permease protein